MIGAGGQERLVLGRTAPLCGWRRGWAIAVWFWLMVITTGWAAERQIFPIGYLGLEQDPRHAAIELYTGVNLRPAIDPADGARVAMRDARVVGRATGLEFHLEVVRVGDPAELPAAFDRLYASGVRFFLADLASPELIALAAHAAGREALLFNISEPDDALRGEQCAANLLHVIPSRSMLTDALAQFLAHKGWRRVLLLRGPEPEDVELAQSYEMSLRKFGLRLLEVRDFVAGNDPRAREKNDIQLLTTGADYDVVLIVDTVGEFARQVPYNTVHPRPVVGSVGLMAASWHWASERFGSPQLNRRFIELVDGRRRMQDAEFAAWAAMRALLDAVRQAKSGEFAAVRRVLLAEDARYDVYKGVPASFRPWDHQLRQPIVLHTDNAVIGYAPLPQFLHARNHLDTLGVDEPLTRCRF